MNRSPTAVAAIATLMLAGCTGTNLSVIGTSAEYNTLISEASRLGTRLAPLAPTPALPSSPSGATYQGVVVIADDFTAPSATGIVGQANLTANFGTPSVTGTGTGFFQTSVNSGGGAVSGSGTPASGSLNFASAGFVGTAFVLNVDGTVQLDGSSRTISTQPILGSFFGPNAEMVSAAGTDVPTTSSGFNVDIAIIAD